MQKLKKEWGWRNPEQDIPENHETIKQKIYNIYIIISILLCQKERRKKTVEEIFEVIMIENLPKLVTQTPEHRSPRAQRTLSRMSVYEFFLS